MAKQKERRNKTDLKVGDKLGMLTILKFGWKKVGGKFPQRVRAVKVKCDCGKVKAVMCHNLKRGCTKSCGCQTRKSDPSSIRDKAIKAGLNYGTVYSRLQRGWTEDQAFGKAKPPKNQGRIGRLFSDGSRVSPVAQKNGISRQLLSLRVKKGWSLKDAATIPPGQHPDRKGGRPKKEEE